MLYNSELEGVRYRYQKGMDKLYLISMFEVALLENNGYHAL